MNDENRKKGLSKLIYIYSIIYVILILWYSYHTFTSTTEKLSVNSINNIQSKFFKRNLISNKFNETDFLINYNNLLDFYKNTDLPKEYILYGNWSDPDDILFKRNFSNNNGKLYCKMKFNYECSITNQKLCLDLALLLFDGESSNKFLRLDKRIEDNDVVNIFKNFTAIIDHKYITLTMTEIFMFFSVHRIIIKFSLSDVQKSEKIWENSVLICIFKTLQIISTVYFLKIKLFHQLSMSTLTNIIMIDSIHLYQFCFEFFLDSEINSPNFPLVVLCSISCFFTNSLIFEILISKEESVRCKDIIFFTLRTFIYFYLALKLNIYFESLTNLLMSLLWVPQIILNLNFEKSEVSNLFIISISIIRCYMFSFFNLNQTNLFEPKSISYFYGTLIIAISIQNIMLFMQYYCGSITIIPKCFRKVSQWENYCMNVNSNDLEKINNECSICLERLVPEVKIKEEIKTTSNIDKICNLVIEKCKTPKRLHMRTPCDHFFHSTCLQEWIRIKSECPICRRLLD